MRFLCNSLEETKKVAADFLAAIVPAKNKATLVTLSGDLGSGKTAFVQCCGEVLGVKEKLTSPTFVIMRRYKIQDLRFKNFVHIDAYRLKNGNELLALGLNDILANPANIIFIEWPENVREALPEGPAAELSFKFIDENERGITLDMSS